MSTQDNKTEVEKPTDAPEGYGMSVIEPRSRTWVQAVREDYPFVVIVGVPALYLVSVTLFT